MGSAGCRIVTVFCVRFNLFEFENVFSACVVLLFVVCLFAGSMSSRKVSKMIEAASW